MGAVLVIKPVGLMNQRGPPSQVGAEEGVVHLTKLLVTYMVYHIPHVHMHMVLIMCEVKGQVRRVR